MLLTSVRSTLEVALDVYTQANNILVAWEGIAFDMPGPAKTWIAPVIVRAPNPNYSTIGSSLWVREHNVLQINIYTPDNNGPAPNEKLAEALNAVFPKQMGLRDKIGGVTLQPPAAYKALGSRNGFFVGVLSIPVQVDYPEQQ